MQSWFETVVLSALISSALWPFFMTEKRKEISLSLILEVWWDQSGLYQDGWDHVEIPGAWGDNSSVEMLVFPFSWLVHAAVCTHPASTVWTSVDKWMNECGHKSKTKDVNSSIGIVYMHVFHECCNVHCPVPKIYNDVVVKSVGQIIWLSLYFHLNMEHIE